MDPAARPGTPPAPSSRPAAAIPAAPKPGAASPSAKAGSAQPAPGSSGRVVHDERGNAVWDWVKQTSRAAIESTTRLLKKLEAPELKMEDTQDEELRIMPEGKAAGYDPYAQATKPDRLERKPDRFGRK